MTRVRDRQCSARTLLQGEGDSRGRWEGNTLVVDVTNFTENTWVVGHGVFHSDQLHVGERYTLIDADTIHYEATITDPEVFTQPWTISHNAFMRRGAKTTSCMSTRVTRATHEISNS